MISYGVTQKPPSEREYWGTQELRSAQGRKGQDRTNIQVTAGEPRLHSPISPAQGSEVRSGQSWSGACPAHPFVLLHPCLGSSTHRPHGKLVGPSAGSYTFPCLSLPSWKGKKEGGTDSLVLGPPPYLTGGGVAIRVSSSCLYYQRNGKGRD